MGWNAGDSSRHPCAEGWNGNAPACISAPPFLLPLSLRVNKLTHLMPPNFLAMQVARFCTEQAEAAAPPAGSAIDGAAADRRTLWSVLRVLALHQGRISSAPYSLLGGSGGPGSGKQQDAASLPEAQLSSALLEGCDVGSKGSAQQQLLLPAMAPATPAAAAAAAAQVQQLLLHGKRSDALR